LCNRRISAKLCRKTLRATVFHPESMIKIRKRGGLEGFLLRGPERAGSSMTVLSPALAASCKIKSDEGVSCIPAVKAMTISS
jgi:hypothetical protein